MAEERPERDGARAEPKNGRTAQTIEPARNRARSGGRQEQERDAEDDSRATSTARGDVREALKRRYFTEEGPRATAFFAGPGAKTAAFRDYGGKLSTHQVDPNTIRHMVAIAAHGGWRAIQVKGDDDFRREVWMEARALGLEVRGYRPRQRDQQELEVRLAAQASRTISPSTARDRRPPKNPAEAARSRPTAARPDYDVGVRRDGIDRVQKTIEVRDPRTGETARQEREVLRNRWTVLAERFRNTSAAEAARDPELKAAHDPSLAEGSRGPSPGLCDGVRASRREAGRRPAGAEAGRRRPKGGEDLADSWRHIGGEDVPIGMAVAGSEPGEARWPVALAIFSVCLLLDVLPGRIRILPAWVLWLSAGAMLAPLVRVALSPASALWRRVETIATLAFVAFAAASTVTFLSELLHDIIGGSKPITGLALLSSSVALWCVNVLMYSLLYWQMDRGGPSRRTAAEDTRRDWSFPQDSAPAGQVRPEWSPTYPDYLFLSFSTATAFSTTEVAPFTTRAKLMMMAEAATSLITLALIAARAVNILGS